MTHPGKKITELDEESVPLSATDIAVIVADVPAAPVTRKTALGTLRRFMLGIATLGTVTIPEAVVVDGSVTAAGFLGNATTASAWATPRQLTIGAAGKAVNGSADVTWTLGEIGAAAAAHWHPIADISGLQAALDGKAPMAHTHPVGDLTGFGAAGGYLRSDGLAWARVAGLAWADVTGAPTTLAGYGITDGVTTGRALTVAGTAGRITSSAGSQTLAADRTWTIDLATSGVGAGTYGGATTVAQITVDAYGRITAASNVGITVDGGNIVGVIEVAQGGTAIGTLEALKFLRANAAATAYEFRTAEQIVSEGGGFPASGNLPFSQIISLPTSLAGYGITDGVAGPSSATANAVAVFNGTTGKLVKNSAFLVDGDSAAIGIAPDASYLLWLYRTTGSGRQNAIVANAGPNTAGSAASLMLGSSQTAAAYVTGTQVSSNTGYLTLAIHESGVYAEKVRITEAGFTKASNVGSYRNPTGTYHEIRSSQSGSTALVVSHTSTSDGYGIAVELFGSFADRTRSFLYNVDNGALRSALWSDGGANFAGNVGVGTTGTPMSASGTIGSIQVNGSSGGGIVLTAAGAQAAYVYTVGATLYLQAAGSVLIGPSNASSGYTTIGTSGITSYDFILSSDLRLKRDPTPITNARGIVRRVPGLRYWHIEHRRWELGFGAQHLLATAIGDLTTMVDSRGYFGVMYERTIPVLWNAVRDQDEDLEALKREVALLRHQLTALQHQPRMAA